MLLQIYLLLLPLHASTAASILSKVSSRVFTVPTSHPNKLDLAIIDFSNAKSCITSWSENPSLLHRRESSVQEVVVQPEDDGIKASDYLSKLWFGTKSRAYQACKQGYITSNGIKIFASKNLSAGDLIRADFASLGEKSSLLASSNMISDDDLSGLVKFSRSMIDEVHRSPPLHILYKDDSMAVVFKPSGLHSLKWLGTMKKRIFALDDILPIILKIPRAGTLAASDALDRPLPCHRLDARVAGCLVAAKTKESMADLCGQFERREVTKEYRAILVGDLREKVAQEAPSLSKAERVISWSKSQSRLSSSAALTSDQTTDSSSLQPNPTSMTVSPTGAISSMEIGTILSPIDGRDAHTDIVILDVTPCPVYGALTTVALYPHTGRRHQLRRHCALLGCPIVGDDMYHDAAFQPAGEARYDAIQTLSVGDVKNEGSSDLLGEENGVSVVARMSGDGDDDKVSNNDEDDACDSFSDNETSTESTEADVDARSAISKSSFSGESSANIPRVRKGVGLFLMCTAVEFSRPIDTLAAAALVLENNSNNTSDYSPILTGGTTGIEVPKNSRSVDTTIQTTTTTAAAAGAGDEASAVRVRVRVECPESPRFERLRMKARSGFEWRREQQLQSQLQ